MKYNVALLLVVMLASCSGNNGKDITASGTIEGTDVSIGAEVAGKVSEVRVDEGSRVTKGDTLILIDRTEYLLQLRQSEANLASLEAAYKLSVEGSRKEDVVQAEAAYTMAQADFDRMRELLASHTITQKQYDDVYSRYVAAEQTYQKLVAGLRPEEVKAARDRRDAAAAQVSLIQKKIQDCMITSPLAGTVTLRAVEPGELVSVGMNVLRITYLEKVKLTIYLNEEEVGRVKLGDSAEVRIDGIQNKSFEGKVIFISPTAEFTPKNVQTKEERTKLVFGVKIEVSNSEGFLKPGLPADATVYTSVSAKG